MRLAMSSAMCRARMRACLLSCSARMVTVCRKAAISTESSASSRRLRQSARCARTASRRSGRSRSSYSSARSQAASQRRRSAAGPCAGSSRRKTSCGCTTRKATRSTRCSRDTASTPTISSQHAIQNRCAPSSSSTSNRARSSNTKDYPSALSRVSWRRKSLPYCMPMPSNSGTSSSVAV